MHLSNIGAHYRGTDQFTLIQRFNVFILCFSLTLISRCVFSRSQSKCHNKTKSRWLSHESTTIATLCYGTVLKRAIIFDVYNLTEPSDIDLRKVRKHAVLRRLNYPGILIKFCFHTCVKQEFSTLYNKQCTSKLAFKIVVHSLLIPITEP